MTPSDTAPSEKLENKQLAVTRKQVFFTCVITGISSVLFLLPDFPFSIGYCYVAMASCLLHLTLFVFFPWVNYQVFNVVNLLNFVLLGVSIHFTGGILSPFNMIFPCILVAGSEFGAKYPSVMITPILIYLVVVFGELSGLFPAIPLSPQAVYRSWPTVLLVSVASIGFMMSSGSIYKLTVKALREKLEKENNFKNTMLRKIADLEAPSQVGLLVHKIIHDIRGPLGAISGFVSMMQSNPHIDETEREDCAMMLQELNRLSTLVNRMLKYTKPGQEGRTIFCPVDLLENVLSVLAFFPGAERIRVRKIILPADTYFVFGNKDELQQAFFNILKNSVEALEQTESTPTITVEMAIEGSFVVTQIIDNGPGIPPEVLARQWGEMISTKKDGAGVGLIIVREILAGHSGIFKIESQRNAGTTVLTKLPLANKKEP